MIIVMHYREYVKIRSEHENNLIIIDYDDFTKQIFLRTTTKIYEEIKSKVKIIGIKE